MPIRLGTWWPLNRQPIKRNRSPRRLGLTAISTGILHPELAPQEIVVDERYRRFIRSLPCAVCAARRGVELAHQSPDSLKGMAQKGTDYDAVPLCAHCHRTGKYAQHGPLGAKFWQHHAIDVRELIAQLNRAFEWLTGKKINRSPTMGEIGD